MPLKDLGDMSADQQLGALIVMAQQQTAALDEIKAQLVRSDQSRSKMHESIESVVRGQDVLKLEFVHAKEINEHRYTAHDRRLAALETANEGVRTLRAKAQGAGLLGRMLIALGGGILGAVASAYGLWHTLFGAGPPR